jgi:ankyrin repeat protein
VVEALLEGGAHLHARTKHFHWTALHTAAAEGHTGVLHTLLHHGADLTATTKVSIITIPSL